MYFSSAFPSSHYTSFWQSVTSVCLTGIARLSLLPFIFLILVLLLLGAECRCSIIHGIQSLTHFKASYSGEEMEVEHYLDPYGKGRFTPSFNHWCAFKVKQCICLWCSVIVLWLSVVITNFITLSLNLYWCPTFTFFIPQRAGCHFIRVWWFQWINTDQEKPEQK